MDHTTDSGSLAGSESVTAKSAGGGTRRATVNARTTANSHDITNTKAGSLNLKKNKETGPKGKQKKTAPNPASDADEFEDDSREREAALSSPISGKTSRELSKESNLMINFSC